MHTLLNRLNAIFFYGLGALTSAAVASWLTSFTVYHKWTVDTLKVSSVDLIDDWYHYFFRTTVRRAEFSIDLEADLSGLFDWNTKQVFLFVVADYQTKDGVSLKSQSYGSHTVWDSIIDKPEDAVLSLHEEPVEYPLLLGPDSSKLRGANVSLSLRWDVMPIAGGLKLGSAWSGGSSGVFSASGADSYAYDAPARAEARQHAGQRVGAPPMHPKLGKRRGQVGMAGLWMGTPVVPSVPQAGCGTACAELDSVSLPMGRCKNKDRCKWKRLPAAAGGEGGAGKASASARGRQAGSFKFSEGSGPGGDEL